MLSWATLLACLLRIPLPERPVPRVLGIDEFALRRGKRYATILIDAESGQRIDVLPDRTMESVTAWLREHRGVEIACRDGASDFAQAITDADPAIAQCMDRWHLWRGLAGAAWKEVAAHSACWAKIGPPVSDGRRAATTRERWHQVHQLLDAGVGLLDCSRRLNLAMNTVKRYARHTEPELMVRAPAYRLTLVDPYREHLRRRRAENPAGPVTRLLHEIRQMGYPGSANLLVRYINQGRVEADHAALSPRRAPALLLADPARQRDEQRVLRDQLAAACTEMTSLSVLVSGFACLLFPSPGNAEALTGWIARARDTDLPFLHSFATGLERDRGRRRRGTDAATPQRPHRGSQQQDQAPQAADLPPGRLPPPPPPHPSQLKRSPATKCLDDPFYLQALELGHPREQHWRFRSLVGDVLWREVGVWVGVQVRGHCFRPCRAPTNRRGGAHDG
ncbi:transposase [Streptomyces violascens]